MPKKLSLSIITINYNNFEGLQKTLESVFYQTFKNFQLIVIDGNSSDDSKVYLQSNTNKIDYWISEPDSGIYNAMNKGLLKTVGDYVLFLNSGDYLVNNGIIKKIEPFLHEAPIVYGNLINVFSEEKKTIEKGANGKELTLAHFYSGGSLPFPGTFISKSIYKDYGFLDENYKIVSDWKLFLNTIVLNDVPVKYVDIEISNFDMNGISNSNYNLKVAEHQKILKELFPKSIILDYENAKEQNQILSSNRFQMLKELEESKIAQKIGSLFLRILLKIFRNKSLSDLS